MTDACERRRALRARIMTELRRAPDGLDPDDVYAYVVRLEEQIDFLEGQLREASNSALLDAMVRQGAEIRRQALAAAERAWTEIVAAADAEAERRREEAMREAGRLLEAACAEMRAVHTRLQAPPPTANTSHSNLRCTEITRHRSHPEDRQPACPSNSDGPSAPMSLTGAEAEPPFRLPSWIEE